MIVVYVGTRWLREVSMWTKKKGDPPLLVRGIENRPPTAASSPYAWFGSKNTIRGRGCLHVGEAL